MSAPANNPVTIRVRKFLNNKLLNRRQMVLDVFHPNRPSVSKAEIGSALEKMFKDKRRGKKAAGADLDSSQVYVFGLKVQFGGGKSTGFALIYDSKQDALAVEPKYRLIRNGLKDKKVTSRKQRKDLKSRLKRLRGKDITRVKSGGVAVSRKKKVEE